MTIFIIVPKYAIKVIMAIFSILTMTANLTHDPKYGQYGCLFEELQKCRSAVKTVCKLKQRIKSYGQNNIFIGICVISFVFLANFSTGWPGLGLPPKILKKFMDHSDIHRHLFPA